MADKDIGMLVEGIVDYLEWEKTLECSYVSVSGIVETPRLVGEGGSVLSFQDRIPEDLSVFALYMNERKTRVRSIFPELIDNEIGPDYYAHAH